MKTNLKNVCKQCLLLIGLLTLISCGGGGGGSSVYSGYGKAPPELVPLTGEYVPVVVLDGSTGFELSATHASYPSTEFFWSSQQVRGNDLMVSYTGEIDSSGNITKYQANMAIVRNGDSFGSVSLTSGGRPVYGEGYTVKKSCRYERPSGWLEYGLRFILNQFNYNENLIFSGNDSLCNTDDDVLSGDHMLVGQFYDPQYKQMLSLFESGIISSSLLIEGDPSSMVDGFFSIAGTGTISATQKRPIGNPYRIVLNSSNALIFEDANQLWLAKPIRGEKYWSDITFTSINGATGWHTVGYDESGLYVYRNGPSGLGFDLWEVLHVDPNTLTARSLGSGFGKASLLLAKDQIWVQALFGAVAHNHILYKNANPQYLKSSTSSEVLNLPIAAGNGRIVLHVKGDNHSKLEIYEENNLSQPLKAIEHIDVINVAPDGNLSINRTPSQAVIYVKQQSYPFSAGHSGGVLASYHPESDKEIVYGTLPSGSIGGSQFSSGLPSLNKSPFKSFVLQGKSGQLSVKSGAKKFSFSLGSANSLVELKSRVQLND